MTSHEVTVAGYLVVLAFAVGLQVAASRKLFGIASIEVVIGRITRSRAGRVGLLAAWAWLGMHFFAL